MSVYAYDADGYVGDLGTNTGWKSLCDFLMDSDNSQAKSFAKDGWSDGIDFTTIDPPEDTVLAKLFQNLKEVASECKEVLIAAYGFEESVEDGNE